MQKVIYSFTCVVLIFLGCQKDEVAELADVNIRVTNTDTITVDVFLIDFGTLTYENIAPGETTEYLPWTKEHRPDIFEIRTERGTYGPVIYDYTPEAYNMDNGFYTMELDGTNIFDFDKD